jgi:DNA-directed RNA polymerase subunit K/omega
MVAIAREVNRFEFVVVSALRAQQLLSGSVRRVTGDHHSVTIAQMEVAEGRVVREPVDAAARPPQCRWQL